VADLPEALTSFVGREREIDELSRLLVSVRLLTLTGVGGCGKTRLALEVARAVANAAAVHAAPPATAAVTPRPRPSHQAAAIVATNRSGAVSIDPAESHLIPAATASTTVIVMTRPMPRDGGRRGGSSAGTAGKSSGAGARGGAGSCVFSVDARRSVTPR
jgi:hypothetical protein